MEYEELTFPTCIYCGDLPEQKEHVLPQSKAWKFQGNYISWILPSCTECNYIAGGRMFRTFGDKTKYIHNELRRKYSIQLNASWDQEELDELGPSLRAMIEKDLRVKSWIEERLRWNLKSLENVSTVTKISSRKNHGRNSAREIKRREEKDTAEEIITTKKSCSSYENGEKPKLEMFCKNCEELFTPKQPCQKFCDPVCRQEHYFTKIQEGKRLLAKQESEG